MQLGAGVHGLDGGRPRGVQGVLGARCAGVEGAHVAAVLQCVHWVHLKYCVGEKKGKYEKID